MDTCFDKEKMCEAVKLASEHRAFLHTVPEAAFEERETTAYIRKVCEGYPVDIIDIGMETGLVCYLDAGAGDTIALRADIDAVPTERGPLHLCGHDAHTASMLGAVHYLCACKSDGSCGVTPRLPHNVLFVFQPAEEGTRGAKAILNHGLLEKIPQRPSGIFGIHNRPEEPVGDIIVHKGALMSEKSVFSITLTGKTGHGSLPHKCTDPIVAAASFISGLQTIVSRNTDPFDPVICTVNSVRAGEPQTAVPESAFLTGYIRSLSSEAHKRMCGRVRDLAEGIAKAYECRCDTEITHMVPAVVNSDRMYAAALKAAKAAACNGVFNDTDGRITDSGPVLASEDFAVFGESIPSFFYWAGSGTPGRENAPWHDPAFDIDPRYFETAVPLLCASAMV